MPRYTNEKQKQLQVAMLDCFQLGMNDTQVSDKLGVSRWTARKFRRSVEAEAERLKNKRMSPDEIKLSLSIIRRRLDQEMGLKSPNIQLITSLTNREANLYQALSVMESNNKDKLTLEEAFGHLPNFPQIQSDLSNMLADLLTGDLFQDPKTFREDHWQRYINTQKDSQKEA